METLSERDVQQLEKLRELQPVVLLGMHRSGTSLMTRLLMDLDIHMGSWLSRDAEAVFFQRLNRRVFAAAGVEWGYVDPLIEAMGSEQFVAQQTAAVQRAILHDRFLFAPGVGIEQFFGRDLWRDVFQEEPLAWGWKDPRTTLTFPIWLRLFPKARWVHVLRNGVDVAISTHRRTLKQRRKLRNRLIRVDYSEATEDFETCFRLWDTYVSFVLDRVEELIGHERYLEVRFEDLLADPATELGRVLGFLGLDAPEAAMSAACSRIDAGRLNNQAYALRYADAIPTLVDSPLMQRLGYSYSLTGATVGEEVRA